MKTQGHSEYAPTRRWSDLVRIPLLLILTALSPVVGWVCAAVFVYGIIASVGFELSAAGPRFSFVTMMAISVGAIVFLALYHWLIAILTHD